MHQREADIARHKPVHQQSVQMIGGAGALRQERMPVLLARISLWYSPTTEIYTLSLHDALPISLLFFVAKKLSDRKPSERFFECAFVRRDDTRKGRDRKSTRLNSSHTVTSYAVFCLKNKTNASARS